MPQLHTQQKRNHTQPKSQFYANLNRGQRIAFVISVAVFAILLTFSGIKLLMRAGKIRIITQFAPYAATVKLNGSTIKNHSTNYLKPGSYQLEVSFDHFQSFKREIKIDTNSKYLVGTLIATDASGENYASEHQIEFIETQSLVSDQLNLEGAAKKKQYPIIAHLPFNSALFSLSYHYRDNSPDNEPILTIKSSPEQLSAAVAKLLDYAQNDDITRYQIDFVGHQNPFIPPNTTPVETNPLKFLKAVFPSSIKHDYRIGTSQTIDNYYITTIHLYDFNLDFHLADYRVALIQNDDQTWSFATTPQVILTTKNSPNIPQNILTAANQL